MAIKPETEHFVSIYVFYILSLCLQNVSGTGAADSQTNQITSTGARLTDETVGHCETLKQVISRKGTRQNDARPQHFVNFGTDMNSDDKAPLRWTVPPQSNVDSRQFLYVPGEKHGLHPIDKRQYGVFMGPDPFTRRIEQNRILYDANMAELNQNLNNHQKQPCET